VGRTRQATAPDVTGTGFDSTERKDIVAAIAAGEEPNCPVCGKALASRPVEHPNVSYVRHRVLLICPGCHRSGGFDLPPD
jgi:hypothetical protein